MARKINFWLASNKFLGIFLILDDILGCIFEKKSEISVQQGFAQLTYQNIVNFIVFLLRV